MKLVGGAKIPWRAKRYLQKIFLFFYLGFTARQVYFTHFEPSKSLGGAKTGGPREKPPDHPQAELGLSSECSLKLSITSIYRSSGLSMHRFHYFYLTIVL